MQTVTSLSDRLIKSLRAYKPKVFQRHTWTVAKCAAKYLVTADEQAKNASKEIFVPAKISRYPVGILDKHVSNKLS